MKNLLLLLTVISSLWAYSIEVDSVVAQIDDAQILKSEVEAELIRLNLPQSEFDKILDEIIDRKLILAAAKASKMSMQEWVVENRVREIVQRSFEGDRSKLNAMLARNKIAYSEWYQRIKEDMIVSAMKWNIVERFASASPAEMKKMYLEHPERYSEGATVTVAVILLKPDDRNKRKEVVAELRKLDFGEVAKRYSADERASEGGVWANVRHHEIFREEIAKEIDEMPKGTISKWIEIDGWSFLLKKIAVDEGRVKSFAEAYDEIEADVKAADSERIYTAWVKRLRAEAYIKVLK